MFRSFLIVLAIALSAKSVAQPTDGILSVLELRNIMIERLAVMPDVARYKWNKAIPVEDLKREAQILAVTVKQAKESGVEEKFATRAIAAQMTASKMLQNKLMKIWQENNQGTFDNVPDLVTDIRPKIVELTPRLLAALKKSQNTLEACKGIAQLVNSENTGVSDDVWHAATDGLIMENCRYP